MGRCLGAIMLVWGLAACGGSPCADKCDEIKDSLLSNFGFSEAQVNCTDAKWDQADTCQACRLLLKADYDISPEGEEFCEGF